MDGLLHGHKGLAYLLCLAVAICFFMAIFGARKSAKANKVFDGINRFGVLMIGRVNLLVGIAALVMTSTSVLSAWVIGSVLLWGIVEVARPRLIAPEVAAVRDGKVGGAGMVIGVVAQLLAIVAIFGLMTVRPG